MAGTGRTQDPDCLEGLVLEVVLDEHPALLSIEEVIRESASDPANFGDRDDARNAITGLVRSGLLHRNGAFVFATRAAVRSKALGN